MLHDFSHSYKILSQAQTIKSFLIIVLQSMKSKHFLITILKHLLFKRYTAVTFYQASWITSDLYLRDAQFEYWHVRQISPAFS